MIKDKFFDRQFYLDFLHKRIGGLKYGYRQNIAITGDEFIGKTSLILKFLKQFSDNRIIIVYLETRPESLASFAKRFIGTLLYAFLMNSGITLKEDLDFLLNKSQRYIPKTVESINTILNSLGKNNRNNLFAELMSLCEIINQEAGKYCVVVFDEFHNLENIGAKKLYHEWSKLLVLQKNTMYIIISSMQFKTKAILARDLSLLFGNFELISLEPFDIKTSLEYLRQELRTLSLEKKLLDFIVRFTGGYPLYLEIITKALLNNRTTDLPGLLEDLLFDTSSILNQKFSNYIKRFLGSTYSQDYLSILYLISCGHNKIKDIAHILHKPRKEILARLNYLLEVDTLTRSGDFLKINDRLFGFWMRFVYQEKLHSLTFDIKNQKAQFRENLEAMISEFVINAQKSISDRVAELMRLFEDETIQLERKRIRLTHFREIKPLEFNTKGLEGGLIARSRENVWVMAFKQHLVTEEDIAEFALECRKYRHKLQRKIIITFDNVDSNAKLRALEEKILTWDLSQLNQILDLFSRPRVIA